MEQLALLDPASRVATSSGTFGNLYWWHSELSYDPAARVVYTIGTDGANQAAIYRVDLGN